MARPAASLRRLRVGTLARQSGETALDREHGQFPVSTETGQADKAARRGGGARRGAERARRGEPRRGGPGCGLGSGCATDTGYSPWGAAQFAAHR